MEPTGKAPKFVRWAVVLGIVVVLNIFFVVLRTVVLPAPDFSTYCPSAADGVTITTAPACDAAGGTWTEYGPAPAPVTAPAAPAGYCDLYAKCQPAYDAAMAHYDLYAFSFMLVLGVLALIAGTFAPIGSSIVSTGLSYGGVVAFIVGSASYWNEAGNWVRLVISLIALLALLYIGWKRFRD